MPSHTYGPVTLPGYSCIVTTNAIRVTYIGGGGGSLDIGAGGAGSGGVSVRYVTPGSIFSIMSSSVVGQGSQFDFFGDNTSPQDPATDTTITISYIHNLQSYTETFTGYKGGDCTDSGGGGGASASFDGANNNGNTGGSGGMAGTINGNPTAAGGQGGDFGVQGGDGQQSGPYTLVNNKGTDIFYSGAGGGGGGGLDGGSVNGYTGSASNVGSFSGGGASFLSNGNAREDSGALGSGGYFNGGGGYYMVEFITEVIPN